MISDPISPYFLGTGVEYATFYTVVTRLVNESNVVADPIFIGEFQEFPVEGSGSTIYIATDYDHHGTWYWDVHSNRYVSNYTGDVWLGDRSGYPTVGSSVTLYFDPSTRQFYSWNGTEYIRYNFVSNYIGTFTSFPEVGDSGMLFVATDTAKKGIYFWNGTEYVAIFLQSVLDAMRSDITDIQQVLYTQYTDLTLLGNPNLGEMDVATNVNLSWTTKFNGQEVVPDSVTLSFPGTILNLPKEQKTYTVNDVKTSTGFTLSIVYKGVTKTKVFVSSRVYPQFFGPLDSATVTSAQITALPLRQIKLNPTGTVTIQFPSAAYLWLCIPDTMNIKGVTSSGFEVTMNAPVTVAVTGKGNYKCYRSVKKFAAGTFVGVIS